MLRVRCLQNLSVKTGVAEQKRDYLDRPRLGSVLHYDGAGRGKQIPKWLDARGHETNTGQQPESVQPRFVIG